MMDLKTFLNQLFTPGTVPCMILGAVLGVLFAVLCLTIGVGKAVLIGAFCLVGAFVGGVKDKKEWVKRCILFFRRDDADR